MSTPKKNYYAFKLANCKIPHWKKGKIIKQEGELIFLEGCPFPIQQKNLYANEKESLINFVKEVDTCTRKNISGLYGTEDIKAYQRGKQLLLKERLKELEKYEQTED